MSLEDNSYFVPAVKKAIMILEYLKNNNEGSTLSEISVNLKIPKSTTFRILKTLNYYDYVNQDIGSDLFTLGIRILALANATRGKNNLVKIALPYMENLTSKTKETSKLGVIKNYQVMVISKVESPKKMSITTEIGNTFPIHAGAASKLLFAYLPEKEIDYLLAQPFKKYTPNTITNPVKLKSELYLIRKQGFAEDNEEYVEGIKALACPVLNERAQVIAAVSIPFLISKENGEKRNKILKDLLVCSQNISDALGYRKHE
jgi:DNA-binding IclR family transcriptional regulator